jgi:ubiquinol-cytochrome c reductase cytochrome b subunit
VNHLTFYSTSWSIGYCWNMGFLLFLIMYLQVITGILLAFQYTSDINLSYYSIQYLGREVYYGWYFYYMHSSGASLYVFYSLLHIGRGLYIGSYIYRTSVWLSGIVLFLLLLTSSFIGYTLAWGQLSFWGGTVISNIFSICSITPFICGWLSYPGNPTLRRYLLIHFLFPHLLLGLSIVHVLYLHYISSSNILGIYSAGIITIYPFILIKDTLGIIVLGIGYSLQILSYHCISHPDNILEVKHMETPLIIVPEWYFLHLFIIIKIVPNNTSGLLYSIWYITYYIGFIELKYLFGIWLGSTLYLNSNNIYIICNVMLVTHNLLIGRNIGSDIIVTLGRTLSAICSILIVSAE